MSSREKQNELTVCIDYYVDDWQLNRFASQWTLLSTSYERALKWKYIDSGEVKAFNCKSFSNTVVDPFGSYLALGYCKCAPVSLSSVS